MIRSRIAFLTEQSQSAILTQANIEEGGAGVEDNPFDSHLHLGSPQTPIMFDEVEEVCASDRSFTGFRKKFINFINEFCYTHGIHFPDNQTFLRPAGHEKVSQYLHRRFIEFKF